MIKIPKNWIALDFETFYDSKGRYSLRTQKFSMTQYVKDDRFKVFTVAVRTNRMKKTRLIVGTMQKIGAELKKLNWADSMLICHNTHFDGFILSYHWNIKPAFYFCTMSAARILHRHDIGAGLDEVAKYYGLAGKVKADALKELDGVREPTAEQLKKLGEYNIDDVDDMVLIFQKMWEQLPDNEILLIHHTINAYCDPVIMVDEPRARKAYEKEKRKRRRIVGKIVPYLVELVEQMKLEDALDDLPIARNKPSQKNPLGTPKKITGKDYSELDLWLRLGKLRGEEKFEAVCLLLNSDPKAAWVLEQLGGIVPHKWSEKQEKDVPALALGDLEFQELALSPIEAVKVFHAARVNVKSDIEENKAWRLLNHTRDGKEPLPILLNYAKAHTNRWTGGDNLNPQNFGRGSELRKSLIAPKGHKVNVVDSGQIEVRINALVCGQDDLLENFAIYDKTKDKNHDPYRVLGADIYGISPTETSSEQRFVGKVGILGLGYQMGAPKYQYTLEAGLMGPSVTIDMAEAHKVVQVYRKKNYAIANMWQWLQRVAIPALLGKGEVCWEFNDGKGQLWFDKGIIEKPNGIKLHYPGLERSSSGEYRYKKSAFEWGKLYGGLLLENIVQSLARDVVGDQIVHIGDRCRIITMTHDESVFLSKTRDAAKNQKWAEGIFGTAYAEWYQGVPLIGEGGFDDCYSK